MSCILNVHLQKLTAKVHGTYITVKSIRNYSNLMELDCIYTVSPPGRFISCLYTNTKILRKIYILTEFTYTQKNGRQNYPNGDDPRSIRALL